MAEEQTFVATGRFGIPLTHVATRMRHKPRIQWRIFHFSTIAIVPARRVRPFVFKPAFGTTKNETLRLISFIKVTRDRDINILHNGV